MANHSVYALSIHPSGGIHHMVQHRLAGHPVQHLGQGGFHAGALTGGQDYYV
jgi:hypothetical protein